VFAELRHEAQPSSRIDLNEGAHCLKPAGAVGTPEVVNIVQLPLPRSLKVTGPGYRTSVI